MMNCSADMPEEDQVTFTIGNWVGSATSSVDIERPPQPASTTTSTTTEAITSTATIIVIQEVESNSTVEGKKLVC